MSDIDEDVMEKARGIAADVMHAAEHCGVDAVAVDIARAIQEERERWQKREPAAHMIIAPGCVVGPTETLFATALHRAVRDYPPGTEVRPVYFAAIRTPASPNGE